MNFIFWILITFVHGKSIILSNNCLRYLKYSVENDLKPYQVTIFMNGSKNIILSKEKAKIFYFWSGLPHVTIDLKKYFLY